jgi:hypothetical protein
MSAHLSIEVRIVAQMIDISHNGVEYCADRSRRRLAGHWPIAWLRIGTAMTVEKQRRSAP